MNVAKTISRAIEASGKKQIDIAREVGFPKPNLITMIKSGSTRLPLGRVPATAKALSLSARALMDKCLSEYDPDVKRALYSAYDLLPEMNDDNS